MNEEQIEKALNAENLPSGLQGEATEALKDFWSQLTLCQADLDELWHKRGLPAWECKRAGYRTNHRSNQEILRDLRPKYNEAALVGVGLWIKGPGEEAKVNSQFCGWGLIRRGKEGGEDGDEWGWKEDGKCNPVIIPYFDSQGRLFHLRPHKGGISGKPPHLYVVRSEGTPDAKCSLAIITEGEFKAWALNAALNSAGPDKFAVAALTWLSAWKHVMSIGRARACINQTSVSTGLQDCWE